MYKYAPIFQKGNTRFVINDAEHVSSEGEEDAYLIGIGSAPECILYKFRFTGDILEIIPGCTPMLLAALGKLQVGIVGGPDFDQAMKGFSETVCVKT